MKTIILSLLLISTSTYANVCDSLNQPDGVQFSVSCDDEFATFTHIRVGDDGLRLASDGMTLVNYCTLFALNLYSWKVQQNGWPYVSVMLDLPGIRREVKIKRILGLDTITATVVTCRLPRQ